MGKYHIATCRYSPFLESQDIQGTTEGLKRKLRDSKTGLYHRDKHGQVIKENITLNPDKKLN